MARFMEQTVTALKAFILMFGSFILTTMVVANAFYKKKQFYPTVVYITKSNLSMAVLYLQALVLLLLSAKIIRKIFFGQLRTAEVEHLFERFWYAITETCLAFAVFRDDFSPRFVSKFTFLLFLKCFHWLAEDRVDFMERSPVITIKFHVRAIAMLACLTLADTFFVSQSYASILNRGASVQLVFGFEYAILLTVVMGVTIKYVLHAIDLHSQTPWENKAVYILYSDLLINLIRVSLYFAFVLIMFKIYGLPLFIIRPMYLTLRALKKAANDVVMSRRAIRNMNTLYPDATPEELTNIDVCIICRDEMTSACKKLPCGHIFHIGCLRSWFQRQQTCPTCRMNVLRTAPPVAAAVPAPGPVFPGDRPVPAAPGLQQPVPHPVGSVAAPQVAHPGVNTSVAGPAAAMPAAAPNGIPPGSIIGPNAQIIAAPPHVPAAFFQPPPPPFGWMQQPPPPPNAMFPNFAVPPIPGMAPPVVLPPFGNAPAAITTIASAPTSSVSSTTAATGVDLPLEQATAATAVGVAQSSIATATSSSPPSASGGGGGLAAMAPSSMSPGFPWLSSTAAASPTSRFPIPPSSGAGAYPFATAPFSVPFPAPPLNLSGLSEDELKEMEGRQRQNLQARIDCLMNIQTLLDAAVVQMQQYSTCMERIEGISSTAKQTGARPRHPKGSKSRDTATPSFGPTSRGGAAADECSTLSSSRVKFSIEDELLDDLDDRLVTTSSPSDTLDQLDGVPAAAVPSNDLKRAVATVSSGDKEDEARAGAIVGGDTADEAAAASAPSEADNIRLRRLQKFSSSDLTADSASATITSPPP